MRSGEEVTHSLFSFFIAILILLMYLLAVDEKNQPATLLQAIINIAPHKKEDIMTAAQKLIHQGLEQGMQKGKLEEKITIAKNMLLGLHLGIEVVEKVTGLYKEALENMLKDIQILASCVKKHHYN